MAYGKPVPYNVSVYFICTKCGKQISAPSYTSGGGLPPNVKVPTIPDPGYGGKCPDTNSGKHVWQQTN